MDRTKPSLIKRFVVIAQPYFFPTIPGGGTLTALLMGLLLLAIFGVLFLGTGGAVLAAHRISPDFVGKTAGGLYDMMANTFHSRAWIAVALAMLIPAAAFILARRHILSRRRAWALLALVLLLSCSVTGINVAFSYIGNYFTNALVAKDKGLCYLFISVYFGGFIVGIPIVAFYGYIQNYLGMTWREWMTDSYLGRYLTDRNYYDIETAGTIDNPDQRIMEDIRAFTGTSLSFLLIVLGSLIDLLSFTGILWSKSSLLVAVVLGYSLTGTVMTVLIGRRLVRLNFNQLRYEADFRYSLVHVRDNAESIAFYQGESQEEAHIGTRFRRVLGNYNLLIGWQRNLSFFTTAYQYLPLVLPFIILFPQYFSGKIEYGDMVQANIAFVNVYGALSLIVSQIEQITNFGAGVERLAVFSEALSPDRPKTDGIRSRQGDGFILERVTLETPGGDRTLLRDVSIALGASDALLIVGRSGIGKSSLLRAVAGLWTRGSGTVARPDPGEVFFLPQKPYMLLGSLRDQLLYPRCDAPIPDDELQRILRTAGLADLADRMGGFDAERDWADVLSLGEQQRLAFARLLVSRPRFAVLDEATSALDSENEARLYGTLKAMGIRYISVGHRISILNYHNTVLDLQSPDQWRLMTVEEYRSVMENRMATLAE